MQVFSTFFTGEENGASREFQSFKDKFGETKSLKESFTCRKVNNSSKIEQ